MCLEGDDSHVEPDKVEVCNLTQASDQADQCSVPLSDCGLKSKGWYFVNVWREENIRMLVNS